MFDSAEAAVKVNMDLWKSSDGRLAVTEDTARYNGCTHKICICGKPMKKMYTCCKECGFKIRREKFLSLPFREWDGEEVVCTTDGDKYFFNEEEIIDYMQDDEENHITEIELLICEENNWQTVNSDWWSDNMPDDSEGELPTEMQKALDNLNGIIEKLPPASYSPGKIRTSYKL